MWANALIGYDVVRTFVDHESGRKNIYQLLQEGHLGEFDGKVLAIGRELFEIVIATDGHEDEDGIEMHIGSRFAPHTMGQEVDALSQTRPGDINKRDGSYSEEGTLDHTTQLTIEEFTELYKLTKKSFTSVGIDIPPGIFALTDEYCGGEDFDFFSTKTIEYLRKRITTDLEYSVHPFPGLVVTPDKDGLTITEEGSSTPGADTKEKVPPDTESIRESYEYKFVMNKMGKGKKSKVVIDTKLKQLRDLERKFLSAPYWVSGMEEIISLRKEIGENDDVPDLARSVFQSYRKMGGWIVLDNLLLMERDLKGPVAPIETIIPEISFWKAFRKKHKGSGFFEVRGDPGKVPEPIKEYQDFFNSIKLIKPEEEHRRRNQFIKKFSPVSGFLDPGEHFQTSSMKFSMQMGHSAILDRMVDAYDHSYCGKLHDLAVDMMVDKNTNKFIRNDDSMVIFNFLISIELPNSLKALAYYSRGLAYRTMKDMRSALRDLDRSLHYNSRYGKAWYMRGRTLVDLDMTDDALVSFQNAIRNNESKAKSWGLMAAIHLDEKRLDHAYSALYQAYALEPENPIVVDLMKSKDLNDHEARKRISERELMEPPERYRSGMAGRKPGGQPGGQEVPYQQPQQQFPRSGVQQQQNPQSGALQQPQQNPLSGVQNPAANQPYPQQSYNQYQQPQQPYASAYPYQPTHQPQQQSYPPGYSPTQQQPQQYPQQQHSRQAYQPYQQPQHQHPQTAQQPYQAPQGYHPQQYPGAQPQQHPGQYPPGSYPQQTLPYGAYQQPIEKKEKPTLQEFLNLVQGSTMHNMFWKLIFASIILQIIILSMIEIPSPQVHVIDFIVSMIPFIAMYMWLYKDVHQKATPDGYDITGYPVAVRMKSEMAWMIMILLFFGTLDILQALSELFDMEDLYWPLFFIWLIFWFKYMVAYIIRFFYKRWFTETPTHTIDLS